ncbi:hypothetical protein [Paracraurococcus lichenis]|uniref:Uncharacterized protein n=1 Tax=Paracraurococcus lichenis TaxID=3064888 RepID=A0ABT9E2K1_9PROT|nr:hypothetical protein [Paracraurococcus sp. LOR1-02]MDO9710394.1 hypothetical protein [Paracraurococcus sp. LOR1-02]
MDREGKGGSGHEKRQDKKAAWPDADGDGRAAPWQALNLLGRTADHGNTRGAHDAASEPADPPHRPELPQRSQQEASRHSPDNAQDRSERVPFESRPPGQTDGVQEGVSWPVQGQGKADSCSNRYILAVGDGADRTDRPKAGEGEAD